MEGSGERDEGSGLGKGMREGDCREMTAGKGRQGKG